MTETLRFLVVGLCVVAVVTLAPAAIAGLQQQGDGSAGLRPVPSPMKRALAEIAADREGVVDLLLSRPFLPMSGPMSDRDELRAALSRISDDRLAEVYLAGDYPAFTAAVLDRTPSSGRARPTGDPLPANFEARFLGNAISDLVFYRVTPCRFFDTRFDNRGPMTANETRAFAVQGGFISNQGGDSADCPEVPFDPPVVVFTLTAANPQGNGNVRAWAFGDPVPGVSNLNFRAGANIANTTIASVCQNCGSQADINVRVSLNQAQVLGDIIGYFERPQGCAPGTIEIAGHCFETALRNPVPAANFFDATADCEGDGGRLPQAGKLLLALNSLAGSAGGEHTSNVYNADINNVASGFRNLRLTSSGTLISQFTLDTDPYRCVFDLFSFQ